MPAGSGNERLDKVRSYVNEPEANESLTKVSKDAKIIASGWVHESAEEHVLFRQWVEGWLANGPSEERLKEGVRLAEARREFFKGVLETDPARVLAAAVPFRLRYRLPADVLALIESRVDGAGELSQMAAYQEPGQDKPLDKAEWMTARVAGRTYEAYPVGEARMESLGWAALHGVEIDGKLALSNSPVRAVEAGERYGVERELVEVCPVSNTKTTVEPEPYVEGLTGGGGR